MNIKAALLPAEDGMERAFIGWLKKTLDEKIFDAVLLPVATPAGDSFAYLLLRDLDIVEGASPLPPVMPVQGGKAISRLTLREAPQKRIAAVVRPCEARAAIELSKLKQAHLENVWLITFDCPGVLPLADYLEEPNDAAERFAEAAARGDRSPMRPTCQICDHFSIRQAPASDLHVATPTGGDGAILLISGSAKGEQILEQAGRLYGDKEESESHLDTLLERWAAEVDALEATQRRARGQVHAQLRDEIGGADQLLDVLSTCINCHNCQRVCPVCYCRQCYFESSALKLPSQNYMARAKNKGALRFSPDTLLFHIGRASHMALSCVSCGACEDACPMDIPVAQVFSLLADRAQDALGYVAGASRDDPLPLVAYEMEELQHVEQAYVETYRAQEVQDA